MQATASYRGGKPTDGSFLGSVYGEDNRVIRTRSSAARYYLYEQQSNVYMRALVRSSTVS